MTLLVSFYQDTASSGNYYEQNAQRLAAECASAGQRASIVKRNYGTDYLSITRAKPRFMLEQLLKHKEDLLFVDVDSTVLKLFDFTYPTLAFAAKPNGKPYGHVHYLPFTDQTTAFLKAWIKNLQHWEGGDHSALWLTLQQLGIEWTPIRNIGTRVRFKISQTPDSEAAQTYLKHIGWESTLRQRLEER